MNPERKMPQPERQFAKGDCPEHGRVMLWQKQCPICHPPPKELDNLYGRRMRTDPREKQLPRGDRSDAT